MLSDITLKCDVAWKWPWWRNLPWKLANATNQGSISARTGGWTFTSTTLPGPRRYSNKYQMNLGKRDLGEVHLGWVWDWQLWKLRWRFEEVYVDLGQLKMAPRSMRSLLPILITVPILPAIFSCNKQRIGPGVFLKHTLQRLPLFILFLSSRSWWYLQWNINWVKERLTFFLFAFTWNLKTQALSDCIF